MTTTPPHLWEDYYDTHIGTPRNDDYLPTDFEAGLALLVLGIGLLLLPFTLALAGVAFLIKSALSP